MNYKLTNQIRIKFFGIVRSIQKGDAPASKFSKQAKKAAKDMEKDDSKISEKKKSFDSDLERMQRERGELMNQQQGPGGPRPPGGMGPGMRR